MRDTFFEHSSQALTDVTDVADSADKAGTVLHDSPAPGDAPDEPPVESSLSGSSDDFEPHSDDEGTLRFYLFPTQD